MPEGEKCADLLIKLGLSATTTDEGAKRPEAGSKKLVNDLRGFPGDSLQGLNGIKDLVILADCNEDGLGLEYAVHKAWIVFKQYPDAQIRVVMPHTTPGKDVYDWLREGHTVADLAQLANETRPVDVKYFSELGYEFDVYNGRPIKREGNYFFIDGKLMHREFKKYRQALDKSKKSAEEIEEAFPAVKVCDEIRLVKRLADRFEKHTAIEVELVNFDGRVKTAVLQGKSLDSKVIQEDLGYLHHFKIYPERSTLLSRYLQERLSYTQMKTSTLYSQTGWHDNAFALPGEVIGGDGYSICSTTPEMEAAFSISGTLSDWQDKVVAMAAGNSYLLMQMGISLGASTMSVAPYVVDNHSLLYHWTTSVGKTTGTYGGASVIGNPEEYIKPTNVTYNTIVSNAVLYNDLNYICDDIKNNDDPGKLLHQFSYTYSGGREKGRLNQDATNKDRPQFHGACTFTGEKSSTAYIKATNVEPDSGHYARIIDIPVGGFKFDAIEDIHSFKSSQAFVNTYKQHCKLYHGTALREYIRKIINGRDEFESKLKCYYDKWIEDNVDPTSANEVLRVASYFAHHAASSEMATDYGIFGSHLKRGDMFAVFSTLYEVWINERPDGACGQREITKVVNRFHHHLQTETYLYDVVDTTILEKNPITGNIKVVDANSKIMEERRGGIKAGFIYKGRRGKVIYVIFETYFKNILYKDMDIGIVEQVLIDQEMLSTISKGVGKKPKHIFKVNDIHVDAITRNVSADTRFYRVELAAEITETAKALYTA
jgi:hypothetical protein